MTIKKWLWVGAIVMIVAGLSILGWWIYKLYSRAEHFEALYYSCMSAPADTVIKVVEKTIFSSDTLRPNPVKKWNKTVAVTDTVKKDTATKGVEVNFYADTYRNDGVRIHYEAIVNGSLQSIRFPEIFIPEKTYTITQKVPIHDTITINKEKSHIGLYSKLWIRTFQEFPGIEGGLIYIWKGKGGIMVGGANIPNADKRSWYGTIGGVINLN